MPHNSKPFEVLAGPFSVWFAPPGTPFPALSSYPEVGSPTAMAGQTIAAATGTVDWTAVGYTDGGVKVGHPQTIVELRADQVTGPIKAVRSEESLELTFSISAVTEENYALALNQALSGPVGNTVKLYRGGFQVETIAMAFSNPHLSPKGDFPLALEVPVAFQAGAPEADFVKDNKVNLAVSFHALVDPNRSADEDAFGQLNAGAA